VVPVFSPPPCILTCNCCILRLLYLVTSFTLFFISSVCCYSSVVHLLMNAHEQVNVVLHKNQLTRWTARRHHEQSPIALYTEAECWVWSTGDDRSSSSSTVDSTWPRPPLLATTVGCLRMCAHWVYEVIHLWQQVLPKVIREQHVATPHGRDWTRPLHAQYTNWQLHTNPITLLRVYTISTRAS